MSNEKNSDIYAPTYNKLVAMIRELTEQVWSVSIFHTFSGLAHSKQSNDRKNKFRMIPDLNITVKMFTGNEACYNVNEWI